MLRQTSIMERNRKVSQSITTEENGVQNETIALVTTDDGQFVVAKGNGVTLAVQIKSDKQALPYIKALGTLMSYFKELKANKNVVILYGDADVVLSFLFDMYKLRHWVSFPVREQIYADFWEV